MKKSKAPKERQPYQSIGLYPELHKWVKDLSETIGNSMGDTVAMLLEYNHPEKFFVQLYMRKVCHNHKTQDGVDIHGLAADAYTSLRYNSANASFKVPDEYVEYAKELINGI